VYIFFNLLLLKKISIVSIIRLEINYKIYKIININLKIIINKNK
jgi:hypothetical protein